MDSFGIEKTVILPHPGRFLFRGGGGTLNVMIHEAFIEGAITPALEKDFEEEAAKVISAGATGFGEMSAEHLSLGDRHPYQSAPPDHPLFLRLSDIAAQRSSGLTQGWIREPVQYLRDLNRATQIIKNSP